MMFSQKVATRHPMDLFLSYTVLCLYRDVYVPIEEIHLMSANNKHLKSIMTA